MGGPRQALGVTDANGGTVHAELPEGINRARLLITGNGLKDVTADYTADSGRTITGTHFAVLDMTRPADIRFKASDLSGVQASLLAEYDIDPAVTAPYRTEPLHGFARNRDGDSLQGLEAKRKGGLRQMKVNEGLAGTRQKSPLGMGRKSPPRRRSPGGFPPITGGEVPAASRQ